MGPRSPPIRTDIQSYNEATAFKITSGGKGHICKRKKESVDGGSAGRGSRSSSSASTAQEQKLDGLALQVEVYSLQTTREEKWRMKICRMPSSSISFEGWGGKT